jgi:hypothetical protein
MYELAVFIKGMCAPKCRIINSGVLKFGQFYKYCNYDPSGSILYSIFSIMTFIPNYITGTECTLVEKSGPRMLCGLGRIVG